MHTPNLKTESTAERNFHFFSAKELKKRLRQHPNEVLRYLYSIQFNSDTRKKYSMAISVLHTLEHQNVYYATVFPAAAAAAFAFASPSFSASMAATIASTSDVGKICK